MPDIAAAKPASGAPIESSWGGEIHNAIEGIQTGITPVVLSNANSANVLVTFAKPYAVAPVVIVAAVSGSKYVGSVGSTPTINEFSVRVQSKDEATASTTVNAHWIAIGVLA